MEAPPSPSIPACFRRFPGVVLQLGPDGCIVDSNGVLERELEQEVRGRAFAELLDPGSTGGKLARLLELAEREPRESELVWELVLAGEESLAEPRTFTVLRDAEAGLLWLIEHTPDPRLDDLRDRVTGVNSELANTQRALLKERARLARALEELEARGKELQRSNESLDEFAHVVSHDLKAPLRSIANHAAWVEEDLGSTIPEESRRHLQRVRERAEGMRAMIDGLLAYAQAGRERAQPRDVDVGELVERVVRLLDPPPEVRVDVAPNLPTLPTERAPLQQVFLNLISNALSHARGASPLIQVSGRKAGKSWEFSVRDNGPGIPPEIQARIWNLFESHPVEGRPSGTGIGLAVVRRLIELRGGSIDVDSREGEGATFHFTWPT
jgi:signal transduction histidine kinase